MKKCLMLLLTLSSGLAFAESYICIPDRSTGFAYNKQTKNWYSTAFNIQDTKYLLSNNEGLWSWKVIGEPDYLSHKCDILDEFGFIECDNIKKFIFNKKTLRFQTSYLIGYVKSTIEDEGEDTPFIEIGRCSKL